MYMQTQPLKNLLDKQKQKVGKIGDIMAYGYKMPKRKKGKKRKMKRRIKRKK